VDVIRRALRGPGCAPTGVLDSEEIALRTPIGYFPFVPGDENERLLAAARLTIVDVEDTTAHLAEIAGRRRDARAERAKALRKPRQYRP